MAERTRESLSKPFRINTCVENCAPFQHTEDLPTNIKRTRSRSASDAGRNPRNDKIKTIHYLTERSHQAIDSKGLYPGTNPIEASPPAFFADPDLRLHY